MLLVAALRLHALLHMPCYTASLHYTDANLAPTFYTHTHTHAHVYVMYARTLKTSLLWLQATIYDATILE